MCGVIHVIGDHYMLVPSTEPKVALLECAVCHSQFWRS